MILAFTRLIKPNRNAIIKMSNMKSYHLHLYLDRKPSFIFSYSVNKQNCLLIVENVIM